MAFRFQPSLYTQTPVPTPTLKGETAGIERTLAQQGRDRMLTEVAKIRAGDSDEKYRAMRDVANIYAGARMYGAEKGAESRVGAAEIGAGSREKVEGMRGETARYGYDVGYQRGVDVAAIKGQYDERVANIRANALEYGKNLDAAMAKDRNLLDALKLSYDFIGRADQTEMRILGMLSDKGKALIEELKNARMFWTPEMERRGDPKPPRIVALEEALAAHTKEFSEARESMKGRHPAIDDAVLYAESNLKRIFGGSSAVSGVGTVDEADAPGGLQNPEEIERRQAAGGEAGPESGGLPGVAGTLARAWEAIYRQRAMQAETSQNPPLPPETGPPRIGDVFVPYRRRPESRPAPR